MQPHIYNPPQTDWIARPSDDLIDYDLENMPLRIKTDSSLESEDEIRVMFYSADNQHSSGFNIKIKSVPMYWLHKCTEDRFKNYPDAKELPSGSDIERVWQLTLIRSSGIGIVVHCNGVEVFKIMISESVCDGYASYSFSTDHWSKLVKKIRFSPRDTASDFYFHFGKYEYILS